MTFAEIEDLLGFALPDQGAPPPRVVDGRGDQRRRTQLLRCFGILASRTALPNLLARTVVFERARLEDTGSIAEKRLTRIRRPRPRTARPVPSFTARLQERVSDGHGLSLQVEIPAWRICSTVHTQRPVIVVTMDWG